MSKLTYEELVALAWGQGNLKYKLYPYQRPLYTDLYSAINNPKCLKYVLNCSRRWGKTTILCLIAIEFCLKKPNTQVRFAAASRMALKKIVQPIMQKLCTDAPSRYRPFFHKMEGVYQFPNGSELHLGGVNNDRGDTLRGTESHLNVIDEAAFVDDLAYVMTDILMPQTLTTGGKTLLASTPPRTPAHDFYKIAKECELDGNYKKYTINDNPSITAETKEVYIKEAGGINSSTWQREYLCEFVVDQNLVVIPEWDKKFIIDVPKNEFREFYHNYVCMDLGFKDFTALVFGFYDFKNTTLVIEDELTFNGPEFTSLVLSEAIKAKEKELWGEWKVYARRCDSTDPLYMNNMTNMHNLVFSSINNKEPEAQINNLRLMVQDGKVLVNSKCKYLIGCLENAIWNEKRTELARMPSYGHFDHLMALVYLAKNIDKATNPIPRLHNLDPYTHYISPNYGNDPSMQTTKDIFENMLKPPSKRK